MCATALQPRQLASSQHCDPAALPCHLICRCSLLGDACISDASCCGGADDAFYCQRNSPTDKYGTCQAVRFSVAVAVQVAMCTCAYLAGRCMPPANFELAHPELHLQLYKPPPSLRNNPIRSHPPQPNSPISAPRSASPTTSLGAQTRPTTAAPTLCASPTPAAPRPASEADSCLRPWRWSMQAVWQCATAPQCPGLGPLSPALLDLCLLCTPTQPPPHLPTLASPAQVCNCQPALHLTRELLQGHQPALLREERSGRCAGRLQKRAGWLMGCCPARRLEGYLPCPCTACQQSPLARLAPNCGAALQACSDSACLLGLTNKGTYVLLSSWPQCLDLSKHGCESAKYCCSGMKCQRPSATVQGTCENVSGGLSTQPDMSQTRQGGAGRCSCLGCYSATHLLL